MPNRDPGALQPRRRGILIVDDDPAFAKELKSIVSAHCDVTSAKDSEGALRSLKSESVSMVFVDLDLPSFLGPTDAEEGLVLVRLISKLHQLPVVVVTNSNDAALRQECREAGAAAVESKEQLRPETLLAHIGVSTSNAGGDP